AAAAQVERAELIDVAYQSHDRAGNAAAHEGVPARRAHEINDRVHILLGGLGGHHHDHRVLLSPFARLRPTKRTPGLWPGVLVRSFRVSAGSGGRPSVYRAGSHTKTKTARAREQPSASHRPRARAARPFACSAVAVAMSAASPA